MKQSLEHIYINNDRKNIKVVSDLEHYKGVYILIGVINSLAYIRGVDKRPTDIECMPAYKQNWQIYKEPKKTVKKYQALFKLADKEIITNELFIDEADARRDHSLSYDMCSFGSPKAHGRVEFIKLLTDRPIECEVEDEN